MTDARGLSTAGASGAGMCDGEVFEARARENFACIVGHVAGLYSMGGASSLSFAEMHDLTQSVCFVLGLASSDACVRQRAGRGLAACCDALEYYDARLVRLQERVRSVMDLWHEVVFAMPPIRNVALRDTLASIGSFERRYDLRFAAHEIPCDIDYPLCKPVSEAACGVDYLEAWLSQALVEAHWLAQFDTSCCIRVLKRVCPDYRGLHVNLCDLLLPYAEELKRNEG